MWKLLSIYFSNYSACHHLLVGKWGLMTDVCANGNRKQQQISDGMALNDPAQYIK